MATTRYRTMETLKGSGPIYEEEHLVGTVDYSVIVRDADGVMEAEGLLGVVSAERSLDEGSGPLILELEDGRRMRFLVTRYDSMASCATSSATAGGCAAVRLSLLSTVSMNDRKFPHEPVPKVV